MSSRPEVDCASGRAVDDVMDALAADDEERSVFIPHCKQRQVFLLISEACPTLKNVD